MAQKQNLFFSATRLNGVRIKNRKFIWILVAVKIFGSAIISSCYFQWNVYRTVRPTISFRENKHWQKKMEESVKLRALY